MELTYVSVHYHPKEISKIWTATNYTEIEQYKQLPKIYGSSPTKSCHQLSTVRLEMPRLACFKTFHCFSNRDLSQS